MKIEAAVVQGLVREAELFQDAAMIPADCGRIDVGREITQLRTRLRSEIDEQLQPWFVLLDESIQFFVQLERFLFEVPLSSALTAYAVTVSKLKRGVISIRELLAIGQDMGARVLARTFVEDIEIAMAKPRPARACEDLGRHGSSVHPARLQRLGSPRQRQRAPRPRHPFDVQSSPRAG